MTDIQKIKEKIKSNPAFLKFSNFLFYSTCSTNYELSKNIQKLKQYKKKFSGKRIFLMGNGPSLRQMQLEKLKNEYVFGFNKCYLLYDSISWRPSFYTAVDTLVLPDISKELNELIVNESSTQYFFPINYYLDKSILHQKNTIWFQQVGKSIYGLPDSYFSANALEFVRSPNTVVITGLQLAVYMGFNPIYLIGCDTNYSIPENVITTKSTVDIATGEKVEGYEITSTSDNDPNHFSPNYFGSGAKWHAPNVNGMIFGYKMAKQVCDSIGVQVYNATEGGMLEIFPRVKFDDLF
jgi:hypothetical protein